MAGKEMRETEKGIKILIQVGSSKWRSSHCLCLSSQRERVPAPLPVSSPATPPGPPDKRRWHQGCGSPVLRVAVARRLSLTQDSVCIVSGLLQRVTSFSTAIIDMSSDHDQVLYGRCVGTEAGSGVCGHTVPDLLLNQPLCSKHITKAVSQRL